MTDRLFIQTDIDVTINVTGVDLADIVSVTITLTKGVTQVTISYPDVVVGVTNIQAAISKTKITSPGTYSVSIRAIDTSGKTLGLSPDNNFLVFWE